MVSWAKWSKCPVSRWRIRTSLTSVSIPSLINRLSISH
jgi:hypothetical protein